MKKSSLLLIVLLAVLLLGFAFWGYREIKNRSLSETANLYSVLSDKSALIIEIRDLQKFASSLTDENEIYRALKDEAFLHDFNDILAKIRLMLSNEEEASSLAERRSFIAFSAESPDFWYDLIAIRSTRREAQNHIDFFRDSLFSHAEYEEIKYGDVWLHAFKDSASIEKYLFVCTYVEGIFIAGHHIDGIQKALDAYSGKSVALASDSSFVLVQATAGKNVQANLYVNGKILFPMLAEHVNSSFSLFSKRLSNFSTWLSLDLSFADDEILVNGYSIENPFTKTFDGQENVSLALTQRLPLNTCFFTSYNISDYEMFRSHLSENSAQGSSSSFMEEHFAGELVSGYVSRDASLSQNHFALFAIKDSTLVSEELATVTDSKALRYSPYSYRNIAVYELSESYALMAPFADLTDEMGKVYAIVLGNCVLVSCSSELSLELASLMIAGYTLEKDKIVRVAGENFSGAPTVASYIHLPTVWKYANEIFDESLSPKLSGYAQKLINVQSFGWEMENERERIYHSAFIQSIEADSLIDAIPLLPKKRTNKQIWSARLSADLVFGPQIVRNKATGVDEILWQDKNNRLHLFSQNGKEIFSAPLNGLILEGEVQQIDYYKNNKWQFVFATARQLYIVDRKGRAVERYPKRLPADASAQVAVFDYDGKKDYRIFVPCRNKKIYLYKKDGTTPPDWTFGNTKGVVANPVQYVRIAGADYLYVSDDAGGEYFLSRRGQRRIKLKTDFNISSNGISFLSKSSNGKPAFVATDKQGNVKQISLDGVVKSLKMPRQFSSGHRFFLTQTAPKVPLFVFVDKNVVVFYDINMKVVHQKELEESDLQPIVYDNYLAVFSSTSKLVHVFDFRNPLEVKEQIFPTEVQACIGNLKPLKNRYVLTVMNGELVCFELN